MVEGVAESKPTVGVVPMLNTPCSPSELSINMKIAVDGLTVLGALIVVGANNSPAAVKLEVPRLVKLLLKVLKSPRVEDRVPKLAISVDPNLEPFAFKMSPKEGL